MPRPLQRRRVQLPCQQCGAQFEVVASRQGKAKFCSEGCRYAAQALAQAKPKQVITCRKCGKEFVERACHAGRRAYCSRECMHRCEHYNATKSKARRGALNPMWQGGRTKHTSGHVYVRVESHPFARQAGKLSGYVFEHRLVMEQWLREEAPSHPFLVVVDGERYLRRDVHVHHRDEDKANNARSNLLALLPGAHATLHAGHPIHDWECWPSLEGP